MKGFCARYGLSLFAGFFLLTSIVVAQAPKTGSTTTPTPNTTNELPTPIARVVWIKGTLTALMQNNENRILQKKSIIYLHDVLKTDDKSQAGIVFTDSTLITLKESTEYSVAKYNEKKNVSDGFLQSTTTGGLRAVTGLISKNNPESFKNKTPVALIGIRGTDFQFVLKNGGIYLGAFKGKPCLTNIPTDPAIKGTQVCCDKDHPYLRILDPNKPAELLKDRPPELGADLNIVQATLPPFQGPGGNPPATRSIPRSGVIDSFCISN